MFHPKGPSFFELAEQALTSTTRGYDLLAPKFEHTPFRTPDILLGPMAEAIGEDGSIEAALDICCGTGAAMAAMRPKCTSHVTGIDLSEGMLEQARARMAEDPEGVEARVLQGDAMAMEFKEEFDVATCCGAFGHILEPDQDRFVDGVKRALKPGGRFIFVTREMPSKTEFAWWAARGFNAAMHVRNAVVKPPFIMFYLTFTLERASHVLWQHGFSLEVTAPYADTPFPSMKLVVATKRED